MSINVYSDLSPEIMNLSRLARDTSAINPELYTKYEVKRGLRAVSYTHLDVYKRQP